MTFCLGITVEEGLVGIADTRITSGNELTSAHKVTTYQNGQGAFFLMTSGLRSVRDKTPRSAAASPIRQVPRSHPVPSR